METVTTTRITAREAKRQLAADVRQRQVANLLGVSRVTLWRWLRDGTLDAMAEKEDAVEAEEQAS